MSNIKRGLIIFYIINILKEKNIKYFILERDLKYHDFIFPLAFKEKSNLSDLSDFLIDNDERYIYKNYEWFTNYINNKYNFGKYNISNILKEDFLVVDIRQSYLRLFREYIPTLRSGRSGILYVKNGILRRISGRESLLLQGFGKIIFDKAKGLNDTILFYYNKKEML